MIWKKHPKKFFSPEEQEKIVQEIISAERKTSGEIRVHLDRNSGEDALLKAQSVFVGLGMTRTKQRNGVLIYLATDQRKFAIVGDEGIHRAVPENFWDEVKEEMQKLFREGQFFEGLCLGVRRVGEKLQILFPVQKADVNELPNTMSESD